ncbi:hypothetical protein [Endozoicomonas sp.]|uniref:hypothetical protein n=1 Tax=Endozoicomonas sp. TaxID=1892382 RepID=UPI003AF843C7
MDNVELVTLLNEVSIGAAKAQKSVMLPAEVKGLLLRSARILTELVEREVSRNAESQ